MIAYGLLIYIGIKAQFDWWYFFLCFLGMLWNLIHFTTQENRSIKNKILFGKTIEALELITKKLETRKDNQNERDNSK